MDGTFMAQMGGAVMAQMGGAFMAQMGGAVMASELLFFGRYAQKTLVFRGVPCFALLSF